MVQDTIQLGAKRPQGKSLSCAKLRGFFNGGGELTGSSKTWAVNSYDVSQHQQLGNSSNTQLITLSARQHLILQTIRWQPLYSGESRLHELYSIASRKLGANPNCQHLFYDNPSRKRLARCTNIPHTGALPTVKGVEQRLRKGFQVKWQFACVGRLRIPELNSQQVKPQDSLCRFESYLPESLSSAAKIRHPARNTRLR